MNVGCSFPVIHQINAFQVCQWSTYCTSVNDTTSEGRIFWQKKFCRMFNINALFFKLSCTINCRSQWPRGLRRRCAAARLLKSWVRIPLGSMDVCCECCVLSGRGLCDELITHPEESYRLWCVVVCDLETSEWRGHDPRWVAAPQKKKYH